MLFNRTLIASELIKLPRIGPATADKILAYRSSYGSFQSIEALQKIKVIGPKTVEQLRPFATVH